MPRDLQPGVSQVEALLEAAGQAGRYQGVSEIGAGGIGVVFKATDRQLNRAVAIKAVHTARLADPRRATRLRSEALAAASLDHPYICKIYELIETGGEQLIVMEFVEGETLARILSRGSPPLPTVLRLAIEIAEGLANAHERGLVHRDLKPSNVMVTSNGHIKLLDFGLARVDASSAPEADTRTPAVVTDAYAGTPYYMAPEQAAGRPVTRRTDVFSLGVVLFQCVTGHLPFEGPTPYGYTSNLLAHDPTPLHKLAPATPADLARLIDRCLEKNPARRPESATAVVGELHRILDALSSLTGASRSVQAERARRKRRVVAIAAVLAVAGLAGWRWKASRDLDDVVWQRRPLLTSSSEESESRISPDGQWVSFLSTLGGTTQLMVRRMDGGDARQVAIGGGTPESQVWSPDGAKLAYVTRQGRDVLLQVVPAFFGGVPERSVSLSPAPVTIRVARWIDQAVYVVTRDGAGRSLHRVNLLDGTYTNVSRAWTLAGTMTGADVSADGRRVVYARSSGGQEDLWVANIDGTSPARLTTDQFFEHHPLWSGRGASVIYQSNRGGQIDLWEVGVESRRSRSLTSSPVTEEPESTSADGRLVSFRQVSETSHLFTWNAANATQLTDDALGDFSPTTARDGAVVFQRSRPSALLGNPLSDSSLLLGVLEGSRFRSAPTTLAEGFAARLSPDGARLAYLQRGADPQRATLVVRDLRSGTTVEVSSTCPRPSYSLSSLEWVDHNLTWNASGTDLFFVDRPDGYVVRRHRVGAGAAEPPLATAGVREVIQDVHLSADGRVLAFIVSGIKGATVHLVDAESGAERSATRLEGPVSARGWRPGDASLIVLRRTRLLDDATVELDVLEVSTTGSVRPIGRLDHALLQTVRLDRSRSAMYVVRSEAGVHNLYEYSLVSRALRRVSDNARPGVTFSGVEPLREGAILGVQLERRSDVYLLDAAPPPIAAPSPPRR